MQCMRVEQTAGESFGYGIVFAALWWLGTSDRFRSRRVRRGTLLYKVLSFGLLAAAIFGIVQGIVLLIID